MDNVTHSLVGWALAEAGLKRTTPLATTTLILAANLPDLDGTVYLFGGSVQALGFRRGWTHGVLAMLILPLLLTAAMLGWSRVRRRRSSIRGGWLLALAAIGVWSHPLLDLLNTYGVRLLMPFSSRWFYGDALFIVDPWVWGTLLIGILLTRRGNRTHSVRRSGAGGPARVALALTASYALAMAAGSQYGKEVVERDRDAEPSLHTLVAPVFGNPFRREVIRQLPGRYETGQLTLGRVWRYDLAGRIPIGATTASARAAAQTAAGATFLAWARFPLFDAREQGESTSVTLSDLRYAGPGAGSWASVTVRVPSPEAARP